jgi:hypothetical protein
MRARLSVTITPDDIGSRVTVRARHHGPEASVYDVVGVLAAWSDGQLTIVRRNGEQRQVPQRDLLAGKVVPPAPPRKGR